MLVFKVPEVEAQFESDFDNDPTIEMGSCHCNYKGPLSGIPLVAAEKLIEEKSNLIRRKQTDPE
jgi:hypothetical protein